jgi:protein-tyrosine phosphatase
VIRQLPLQGGRNFRDLGGYQTTDGRRTRWGRLYRSGVMHRLTDEDCTQLSSLGIRVICDLRTPGERHREPTRLPTQAIEVMEWDYDHRHISFRAQLSGQEVLSPEVVRGCMLKIYRSLPQLLAEQFGGLLQRVAADDTPLVFHCSAGKDRTGIASALILSTLGVPRDQIFADYILTNSAMDLEAEHFTRGAGQIGIGDEYSMLHRTTPEIRAPLLRAFPEYLDAAFTQIESDHGSVANYLAERLGVSDELQQRMRVTLLEA